MLASVVVSPAFTHSQTEQAITPYAGLIHKSISQNLPEINTKPGSGLERRLPERTVPNTLTNAFSLVRAPRAQKHQAPATSVCSSGRLKSRGNPRPVPCFNLFRYGDVFRKTGVRHRHPRKVYTIRSGSANPIVLHPRIPSRGAGKSGKILMGEAQISERLYL